MIEKYIKALEALDAMPRTHQAGSPLYDFVAASLRDARKDVVSQFQRGMTAVEFEALLIKLESR